MLNTYDIKALAFKAVLSRLAGVTCWLLYGAFELSGAGVCMLCLCTEPDFSYWV